MKSIFSLLFLLFSAGFVMAQEKQPVTWTFSTQQDANGKITVFARALIDNGWHIFSPEPGGDGLLIPTQLTLSQAEKLKEITPVRVEGKTISKEMEGVGKVNFYEHQAVLMISFSPNGQHQVKGTVSYQMCNDQICLPPTEQPFELKF